MYVPLSIAFCGHVDEVFSRMTEIILAHQFFHTKPKIYYCQSQIQRLLPSESKSKAKRNIEGEGDSFLGVLKIWVISRIPYDSLNLLNIYRS